MANRFLRRNSKRSCKKKSTTSRSRWTSTSSKLATLVLSAPSQQTLGQDPLNLVQKAVLSLNHAALINNCLWRPTYRRAKTTNSIRLLCCRKLSWKLRKRSMQSEQMRPRTDMDFQAWIKVPTQFLCSITNSKGNNCWLWPIRKAIISWETSED